MFCVCRSRLHGVGLFVKEKVSKGHCVLRLDKNCGAKVTPADDYFGRYINHSDDPTCSAEGYVLTAQRDMFPGEEITIDYATINVPVCESWKV